MRRQARAARGAREHDPLQIGRVTLVVAGERAVGEQLAQGLRREPAAQVRRCLGRIRRTVRREPLLEAGERCVQVALDDVRVAPCGLGAGEQHVERADVGPGGGGSEGGGLDERGAAARERVAHDLTRLHVPGEERLDELRHELAEIRMQRVHVTGALVLRELLLGPREVAIDLSGTVEPVVDRRLRRHPPPTLAARPDARPVASRVLEATERAGGADAPPAERPRARSRTTRRPRPGRRPRLLAPCSRRTPHTSRRASGRARRAWMASGPTQQSQHTSHHSLRNTPTTLPSTSTCSG